MMKDKAKYLFNITLMLFVLGLVLLFLNNAHNPKKNEFFNQNTLSRNALEKEGRRLMKKSDFKGALDKFHQALDASYINHEWQKGYAKGQIVKILLISGRYEDALREWQWFLQTGKDNSAAKLKENQILALIEYQRTGDESFVLEYINQLLKEFAQAFPPDGVSERHISRVLQLYDAIGEQGSAINLLERSIDYLYTNNLGADRLYSSGEVYKYVTEKGVGTPHRPDWLFYKRIGAYLTVKEAFEKDKEAGFKGCLYADVSIDNPCMSNANKALIQSEEFPW